MSEAVDTVQAIQDCLIKIEKRAERAVDQKLAETFVDAAPLLASISTNDHQVVFGRRGTGKTHLLKYLHDSLTSEESVAIYLDLRVVGSNGSIYNDRNKSQAQRATPLLLDVLGAIHDALLEMTVEGSHEFDLSSIGPRLDEFATAISTVEVVGAVETTATSTASNGSGIEVSSGISVSPAPSLSIGLAGNQHQSISETNEVKRTGSTEYYVRFGTVQAALSRVLVKIDKRVILLLDEWSEVPLDLQPYLADLFRRCVLPSPRMTVKIAAIEHRSNFMLRHAGGYLGLEVGADIGADVNLDDFMVFDNNAERSKSFFANILFKHYRATEGLKTTDGPQAPEDFINQLFTQVTAFDELVRAAEGVPRDAVYLASLLARRAYGRNITVNDVRVAARDWYQQDKTSALKANPHINELLEWIINEVIAHRRARAFLLPANQRHPLIETLFDARLLHVLKRNVSSNDAPGQRYIVYKLDFGCYVDLISTGKGTLGLLPMENDEYIDVPPDDYRSIRRAILDTTAFESSVTPLSMN